MADTQTKDIRFSNEDVLKILDLAKSSDSIELKLTVPPPTTARWSGGSGWIRSTRRSVRSTSSTLPRST